jgi:hypothetical protein
MEINLLPIVINFMLIYSSVYGLPSVKVQKIYEKMYYVTSAGMSGGRKWEDFRWEDGWPVERAETKMTDGTEKVGTTAPDGPAAGKEMCTDPEGTANRHSCGSGKHLLRHATGRGSIGQEWHIRYSRKLAGPVRAV